MSCGPRGESIRAAATSLHLIGIDGRETILDLSLTSPAVPEVMPRGPILDLQEEVLAMVQHEAGGEPSQSSEPVPADDLDPTTYHLLSPIAAVIDFVNTTCAQYDRLIEKMGLSPGGTGLPGCLFHWARSTPDGLRITEVWRNRDSFESYLAAGVGPVIADLRLAEPEITLYDVHNYLTASDAGGLTTSSTDTLGGRSCAGPVRTCTRDQGARAWQSR